MRRIALTALLAVAMIVGLMPAGALATADYNTDGDTQYWYDDFSNETDGDPPDDWERVYNVPSGSPINPARLEINTKDETIGGTCVDTGTGCQVLHWRFPSGDGAQAIKFAPGVGDTDPGNDYYEAITRVYAGNASTGIMSQGSGGSDWTASQLSWRKNGSFNGGYTDTNNVLHHYQSGALSAGGGWVWLRIARTSGGMEACVAGDTTHVPDPPVPSHNSWLCETRTSIGGGGDFGMRLGYGVDRYMDLWSVAIGEDCADGDCAFWHDNEDVTP